MKKRKLFIDTDAGTDDAIALIMAMRDAETEIVGISTSGGNVPLDCVVQNVLYVQEMCMNQSPVYKGAAQPLQRILGTADFIHGKDGLGDIGLDLKGRVPREGIGSDVLIEALEAYPEEVEVVCLGPLTNIALAEQTRSGILQKAKMIYIMGGLVTLPGNVTPMAEYNIWADPEAADQVLRSRARMCMIGWDTTLCSSNLSIKELAELRSIKTKYAIFSADIQGVRIEWMREYGEDLIINLADPLAMAVVLDDTLVTRRSGYDMSVRGGTDDDDYRGFIDTSSSEADDAIDYIHSVDRVGFLALLQKSLS